MAARSPLGVAVASSVDTTLSVDVVEFSVVGTELIVPAPAVCVPLVLAVALPLLASRGTHSSSSAEASSTVSVIDLAVACKEIGGAVAVAALSTMLIRSRFTAIGERDCC